jgi:L-alanine-DL-glutamate epimerase-like enolase superfamily enzyme
MTPVTIDRVSLRQVNLPPKVLRTDAIQSFVTQETILLTLHCSDGIAATGYAYTIGTGGSAAIRSWSRRFGRICFFTPMPPLSGP